MAELKRGEPFSVSPQTLVTARRYDVAIKWRHFMGLLSIWPVWRSSPTYLWHIAKRHEGGTRDSNKVGLADYLAHAEVLAYSMRHNGFDKRFAIPVDRKGELMGGAHRLACALALKLEQVPILCMHEDAWAPPWGLQWFIDNGMPEADLERLKADFEEMQHA